MTCSHYRHTLQGVVLLDYGERMMAEPSYPLAAQVQESQFVGRKWGKARARGNILRTYSWTRILSFATLAERQTRQLQLPASFLSLPSGDLLIEVEDGGKTLVKDFALTAVTPAQRWEKNATDLLLTFEGIGGEEVTIDNGAFGDRWLADDSEVWDSADTSTWKLI